MKIRKKTNKIKKKIKQLKVLVARKGSLMTLRKKDT
jgi:hypothetical protein